MLKLSEKQIQVILKAAERMLRTPGVEVVQEALTKDTTEPGDAYRKTDYSGARILRLQTPPDGEIE